ncbi:Autophagy protein 22 [Lambiella insularis]|nr:Autophagy protein 22 [Lambiella insularis]
MVPRVEEFREQAPLDPPPLLRAPSSAKVSFVQSPTSSFEADDEDSIFDFSNMDPDQDGDADHRAPRYPGEDTRLTSDKEVFGWYSYGWAAEVFVVCGVGSFIPITLEQLARERGVLLSDGVTPCSASTLKPSPSPTALLRIPTLLARGLAPRPDKGQCIIHLFGAEINTASFAMYTFSISVLLQALLIISMSGAADHGRSRKTLLLSFAVIGSIATMLFLPVVPKVYLLAAVLAIISNTCFGASFVLLNSFLPLLVRHHPSLQTASDSSPHPEDFTSQEDARHPDNDLRQMESSASALLPAQSISTKNNAPSPALQLSTKISSYGIGIGYSAAVLVQMIAIAILVLTGQTTFSLRLVLFFVGLWWFIFTIPAALYLRPRPGPPIPGETNRSWVAYFSYSWHSLGKTILRARHLKDVVLFLLAWFLLSDGIATVSGTAVLFAKTELAMAPTALAFINVIATLSGVFGAFAWSRLSRYFRLRPTQTILACICLFEVIPLYGLLGYIPFIRRLGVFGLQQEWEMYVLGALYGLVMSGLSAYCRSLFGELIPPGSEAAFYALYAITDKGSSVFGPAIVGAITDRYGEIRPAFAFLAILIALPLPLMAMVDVERGKREGMQLAKELAGRIKNGYEEITTGRRDYVALRSEEGTDEQPHVR